MITVSVAGIASSTQYFSPVTYMKTTLDNDPVVSYGLQWLIMTLKSVHQQDGILGLGYQSLSSIRQKPVFVNVSRPSVMRRIQPTPVAINVRPGQRAVPQTPRYSHRTSN